MSRDYREKTITGYIFDLSKPILIPKKCNVGVRMTSDKIGQSLSLQAYNIMIEIPLESVKDIIQISSAKMCGGDNDADSD